MFTPSGCKDLRNGQFEFVGYTQKLKMKKQYFIQNDSDI